MPANAAIRDYLMTRRSVGQAFLKEPGPNAEELQQILTIGTRVPDHGKLNPWRLVLYTGDDRVLIGEKLAGWPRPRPRIWTRQAWNASRCGSCRRR